MGKKDCQNEEKRKQLNPDAKIRASDTRDIKVLFTNCDTLTNKMPELLTYIDNQHPLILGLNEVKPKHYRRDLTVEEFRLKNYEIMPHPNITEKDSSRGTILHVHNSLPAKQINIDVNGETFQEVVFSEISLGTHDKLLVGCFYRSGSNTDKNTEVLMELFKKISEMNYSHILFMGDFNFPEIDWKSWSTGDEDNTNNKCYKFLECIRDCYFYQHSLEPTRGRGTDRPSTLDLIFTNEEGMVNGIDINPPIGKSDHSVLMFDFTCHMRMNNAKKKKAIPQYEKGDYILMRQLIEDTQWERLLLLDQEDIDKQWDSFLNTFKDIEEQCIPIKYVQSNLGIRKNQHSIKVDHKVLQKINRKKELWKHIRKSMANEQQKLEYRRVTNQVRRLTRKFKKNREKIIADQVNINSKKFWSYAQSKMRTKPGIPDLVYKGETACNNADKAEMLATFYSTVFTEEPNTELPTVAMKEINEVFHFTPISEDEIIKKLEKLKTCKSPGPDGIHPRLLQETAHVLSSPLKIIFNNSLRLGIVPSKWKEALITAIFKKGNKSTPGNYRPVSLTAVVCKVMESIIRDRIVKHMLINNLFSSKQFGFIKGRSTVLQLLYVLDMWTEALDNRDSIDAIYCDYMKAFDKVPHKRLVHKLRAYGIENNILSWITSFLCGRTQQVVVNGSRSRPRAVISGIPQGSVLGSILFVIYINDLPEIVDERTHVFLFADDTINDKTSRGNRFKLYHRRPVNNLRKYSFGMRVTKPWNDLPDYVVAAPNVKILKRG